MSIYTASVKWTRRTEDVFINNQYSRGHTWEFDGGVTVPASSSPHIVPEPYSVAANVDPEEAFVASLSSCHMLYFLHFAAKKHFLVEEYIDSAEGLLEKNTEGKVAMTKLVFRPKVIFSGEKKPTQTQIEQLHHQAHEACFLANSVRSEILVEPLY